MSISLKSALMLERAKAVGWDLGLSSIKALLEELDNPQDKVLAVHVTGTNGKGSVCSYIENTLVHAGYKVGKYSSPAVETEYERYCINKEYIAEDTYNRLLDIMSDASEHVTVRGFRHPSLFEIETAMAFLYFQLSECDLMIIEVGMGGLLDATNVISNTAICVFTSIGLDHCAYLGNSLEEIAKNKAGIIKPGCKIISALQEKEVEAVLKDTARANFADISFEAPLNQSVKLGIKGTAQYQNAAVSKGVIFALKSLGFKISEDDIFKGLENTRLSYRFDAISDNPLIILDGAHNIPAVKELKRTLISEFQNKNLCFIVSVLADKDYQEMFKDIFPIASVVIVVETNNARSLPLDKLYDSAQLIKEEQSIFKAENYDMACDLALKNNYDAIIVFGTFTFLNDIRETFGKKL